MKFKVISIVFFLASILSISTLRAQENVNLDCQQVQKEIKSFKIFKVSSFIETVLLDDDQTDGVIIKSEDEIKVDRINKSVYSIRKKTSKANNSQDTEEIVDVFENYLFGGFGYLEHKLIEDGKIKDRKWVKSQVLGSVLWDSVNIDFICSKSIEDFGLSLTQTTQESFDNKECYKLSYAISKIESFKKFAGPEKSIIFNLDFFKIDKEDWIINSLIFEVFVEKDSYYPLGYKIYFDLDIDSQKTKDIGVKNVNYKIEILAKFLELNKVYRIILPNKALEAEETK